MGGVITNTVQDRGARCQSSVVPPLPNGDGGVTDRATRGACSAGSGVVRRTTSLGLRPPRRSPSSHRLVMPRRGLETAVSGTAPVLPQSTMCCHKAPLAISRGGRSEALGRSLCVIRVRGSISGNRVYRAPCGGGRGKEEPLSAIARVLHAARGDDGLPPPGPPRHTSAA